jgi:hypothetical protein
MLKKAFDSIKYVKEGDPLSDDENEREQQTIKFSDI